MQSTEQFVVSQFVIGGENEKSSFQKSFYLIINADTGVLSEWGADDGRQPRSADIGGEHGGFRSRDGSG